MPADRRWLGLFVLCAAIAPSVVSALSPLPSSTCAAGVDTEAIEVESDGAILRGHVYLPPGTGPFPVVLEASPYWAMQPGGSGCLPMSADGPFLREGLAYAAISLRGTGESDGCFQFGGPVDVADVGAMIRAVRAHPLLDGHVAVVGASYSGMAAFAGIASGEPLDAAVIVSGPTDWWSVHTRDGAVWMPAAPAPTPAPVMALTFVPGVALGVYGVAGPWGPTVPPNPHVPPVDRVDCPIHLEHAAADADLLAAGDRTPYWDERDLRPLLSGRTTPLLYVNGLRNLEEMVQQTDGLWETFVGEKRFVLGNWNHLGVPPGFNDEMENWLLHYLRGDDLTGGLNLTRYQDTANTWRTSSEWPPQGERVRLVFSGTMLEMTNASAAQTAQTFQSVDFNPCLGLCVHPPVDFQPVCGPFQATYVSAPLDQDIVLAGNYRVRTTLVSDADAGNLAAFLFASRTGECPDPSERELRRALGSLRHITNEYGAPFPIGEPTLAELESIPFVARVHAGERLVLAIGGGATSLMPRASHPQLTVLTGPDRVGELEFVVVEGSIAFS